MTVIVEVLGANRVTDVIELSGFIPMWLDTSDMRKAAVQLNEHYQHGGGWQPFGKNEWRLERENCLKYPGDPLMAPIGRIQFRDEEIFIYRYGMVMIKQADGSFEVARMD